MDSEGSQSLIVLVSLIIAVIGMLANGFVVAAISGDKIMRRNSMYLLLANLALADLLYLGGSAMTTAFVKHNDPYLRAVWSYILQLAIFASIYTNVAVCIERYVAVVHSLHFNRIFRPGRVILYCILLWILAAALYVPHYIREKHNPEIRCSLNEVWKDCPLTEATCENLYAPSCYRYCAPSAYRCRDSHVRTTEGTCVERRQCPGRSQPFSEPSCMQNESFTVCSTPEGACDSVDPRPGPFGPPKCECILGFVRHGRQCIHHSDCPALHVTNDVINKSSSAPPEKCPRGFDVYSNNFFGPVKTLKAIVEGRAAMCWQGRPECPKFYSYCIAGANASRTFCCGPTGGGGPFPMAPDVCATGGARIRSPIKWYWKVYKILDWILCVLLPIVVLSVFYTLTCRRLWSGDGRLHAYKAAAIKASDVNQKDESRVASRRGVVRMLIICVVVFYVCYAFPSVVYLMETIVDNRPIVSGQMARLAALLVVVASSVNPFIYTALSKSFRERLGHMVPCRLLRTASVLLSTDKSTSSTDSSK